MSSPRSRRAGSAAAARRVPGRPLVRAASRPVPTIDRLRTANRPAPRRPGRRRLLGRRAAATEQRPLFTGRAVLLVALVLLLGLTLTGPARQWLAGRAEIGQLATEGTRLDARLKDLQAQLDRQADPAYTARQARQRLAYVLPGDRLVVVVDGTTVAGDAGTLAPDATHRAAPVPWYEGLMQSVATADGDPRTATRAGK